MWCVSQHADFVSLLADCWWVCLDFVNLWADNLCIGGGCVSACGLCSLQGDSLCVLGV